MKYTIKLILLISALMLTGCSSGENDTELIDSGEPTQIEESVEDRSEEVEEDNMTETEDEHIEDQETDDEEETEESEETISMESLHRDSDYVLVLNITQTGKEGRDVNIIEEYKGSLKNILMPTIPGITPGQNYLIFLKDGPDGEIILTDEIEGLIEVRDEHDPIVEDYKSQVDITD